MQNTTNKTQKKQKQLTDMIQSNISNKLTLQNIGIQILAIKY